jgi:CubicO group peptidase (beta-lactamase class C family)
MTDRLDTIGDYIEEAMASWQVPGLALAVVKGGEIVHMQGHTVRAPGPTVVPVCALEAN